MANKIINNGQVHFMNQIQTIQLIQELLQSATNSIDRNDYLEIGQSLSASKYIQTDALTALDNQLDSIIHTVRERSQSGKNSIINSTLENGSYVQQLYNTQNQHVQEIQQHDNKADKSYDTEMEILQKQLKHEQSQSQLIHEIVAQHISNPEPPRSKSQQKDIQDLLDDVQPVDQYNSAIHEYQKEILQETEEKPVKIASNKAPQRLEPLDISQNKQKSQYDKSKPTRSDSQISDPDQSIPSKAKHNHMLLQRSSSNILSNIEVTFNDSSFVKQKQEADRQFKESLRLAAKPAKRAEFQEPAPESVKEQDKSVSRSSSYESKDALIRQLSKKAKLQSKIIKQLLNDNIQLQSRNENLENDGLTAYERIARKYRSDNYKSLKKRSVLPDSPYNDLRRFERNINEKKRFLRGIESFLENLD